jgi:hypothetical protein
MVRAGAKVAVGQYDEARYLYTSPAFATGSGPTDEFRTIHLGIDLFTEAGTAVYAPLGGTIFAFADNASPQDYGPVIVLQHQTGSGDTFYTLYGHLDRESLPALKVGDAILKGQRLAAIGSAEVTAAGLRICISSHHRHSTRHGTPVNARRVSGRSEEPVPRPKPRSGIRSFASAESADQNGDARHPPTNIRTQPEHRLPRTG